MFGFSWWKRGTDDKASPREDAVHRPVRHFADAVRTKVSPEEFDAIRNRALVIDGERRQENSRNELGALPDGSATEAAGPSGEDSLYAAFLQSTHCLEAFDISCEEDDRPLDIQEWTSDTSGPLLAVGGALRQLLDDGLALWDAGTRRLRVPDVILSTLPAHFLPVAGLPPMGDIGLRIATSGVTYTKSFAVRCHYMRDGMPVQFPLVEGMTIRIGRNRLTLPAPIFYAGQALEEFSKGAYASDDERNCAWAKATSVVSLSPVRKDLEGQVGTARLMAAMRISIEKDENGEIRPVFLTPAYADGEVNFRPLLSPEESEHMARFMRSGIDLSGHLALGNRAYLFMTPEVRQVVGVIRKASKGSPEEKAAFFANPTKVIVDALENTPGFEDIGEQVDAIFVETPEYLSQRVEAFGPWEPKSLSFVNPVRTEWFADGDDRYGIMIGGDLVWVKPEDVEALVRVVEENLRLGNSSAAFRGQQLDIDGADLTALRELVRRLKEKKPPEEEPEKKPKEPRERKTLLGPLLKTNFEELEYEAEHNRHDDFTHDFSGLLPPMALYPHQVECLEWLEELWRRGWPGALLADDMGLGKTLQSLSFLKWLADGQTARGTRSPALIIAPAGLISNWDIEARKYFGDAIGQPLILSGPRMREVRKMPPSARLYSYVEAGIVITTYETVRDKLQLFSNVDWGLIILDEAQKVKNPTARVTNAVASLKAGFVLAMTGTPVENSFMDLWSIMNIAVPGFLRSAREFAADFCNNEEIERAGTELNEILTGEPARAGRDGTPAGTDALKGRRIRLMLRRLKGERLRGLPEKREDVRRCVMPPEQATAYRQILADRANSRLTGESVPGLVTLQRLSNCSLSPDPMEEGSELSEELIRRSARLTALFDMLDEISGRGEKAIVFVLHLKLQQALAQTIRTRYRLDHLPGMINGSMEARARQCVVRDFQERPEGEFDVLVLTGRAAGTGLTLTAANHVIHLERWWNPAVEDQCSDRAYRIGQKHDVTIHIPLAVLAPDDDTSFDARLNDFLTVKRIRSAHVLQPSDDSRNTSELVRRVLGNAD